MTWSTIILTPLTFLFPELKETTIKYEWFVDSVWLFEIFLSFFKGHIVLANTFSQTAKRYMTDKTTYIGPFWFDLASTVPPMLFREKNNKINALKFLRLYHIGEMFYPAELLVSTLMRNSMKYYRDIVVSVVNMLLRIFLSGHFCACILMLIGNSSKIFHEDEMLSFMSKEGSEFEN
jgi:hypothetical protein